MNRDLFDALAALAVSCHSDLLRAHPGLQGLEHTASITDDEHQALLLLTSIDALLQDIHALFCPVDPDQQELPYWSDDLPS
jgi:hypothetical protein